MLCSFPRLSTKHMKTLGKMSLNSLAKELGLQYTSVSVVFSVTFKCFNLASICVQIFQLVFYLIFTYAQYISKYNASFIFSKKYFRFRFICLFFILFIYFLSVLLMIKCSNKCRIFDMLWRTDSRIKSLCKNAFFHWWVLVKINK